MADQRGIPERCLSAEAVRRQGVQLSSAGHDWCTGCWEWGFILRYPADKTAITGITNEPWHFRYVGVDAAMEMHETGECLEEYVERKQSE